MISANAGDIVQFTQAASSPDRAPIRSAAYDGRCGIVFSVYSEYLVLLSPDGILDDWFPPGDRPDIIIWKLADPNAPLNELSPLQKDHILRMLGCRTEDRVQT